MSDFYAGELRQMIEAGAVLEVLEALVKEIEYLRERISELEGRA